MRWLLPFAAGLGLLASGCSDPVQPVAPTPAGQPANQAGEPAVTPPVTPAVTPPVVPPAAQGNADATATRPVLTYFTMPG